MEPQDQDQDLLLMGFFFLVITLRLRFVNSLPPYASYPAQTLPLPQQARPQVYHGLLLTSFNLTSTNVP